MKDKQEEKMEEIINEIAMFVNSDNVGNRYIDIKNAKTVLTSYRSSIENETRDKILGGHIHDNCETDCLEKYLDSERTKYIRLSLIKELDEKIENSPMTFGLIDKKGRGGAILVSDIKSLLNEMRGENKE